MWFIPLVEGFAMELSFADCQLLFIAENKGGDTCYLAYIEEEVV